MNAIINEPHTPVSEINEQVPPGLSAVIDRALAKDPANRYHAVEVSSGLECRAAVVVSQGKARIDLDSSGIGFDRSVPTCFFACHAMARLKWSSADPGVWESACDWSRAIRENAKTIRAAELFVIASTGFLRERTCRLRIRGVSTAVPLRRWSGSCDRRLHHRHLITPQTNRKGITPSKYFSGDVYASPRGWESAGQHCAIGRGTAEAGRSISVPHAQ